MFNLQSITKNTNYISFEGFVQNVANSNPQIGRGFMGNVSFVSGLPNGLTKGTMTVMSYGEGFYKFILDVESAPNHYECYRLSDGTITDWTTGQGGGGETIIVTADATNINPDSDRFDIDHLSMRPEVIWDLVVNQNKNVVLKLKFVEGQAEFIHLLKSTVFFVNPNNNGKIICFENSNIIYANSGFGMMWVRFASRDGSVWETYCNVRWNNTMTNVTWRKLDDLRDLSQLVPGMQYRITDYECSTSQEYTQSANNMFDIIVTADDERTLNENARACKRDWEKYFNENVSFKQGTGDDEIILNSDDGSNLTLKYNCNGYHSAEEGYDLYGSSDIGNFYILVPTNIPIEDIVCNAVFMADMNDVSPDYGIYSSYTTLLAYFMDNSLFVHYFDNSNLSAWELKYCLDNDTNRFAWALEGQPGEYYHLVDIAGTDDKKKYTFRTTDETEEYWRVYNIDEPSVVGYIKPNLDPVTDSNFILYKDEGLNLEYGGVYGTSDNPAKLKQITLVDNPGTTLGKGVIYYMKDEFGNECPYDFKNIMFYDYATSKDFYTFECEGDGTITNPWNFRNNSIGKYFVVENNKQTLNNIILVKNATNNTFANDCHDCKFDVPLESCCFGEGCNYITTNKVYVMRNLVFGNNVNNLRISSDDVIIGVSDGWVFDANTFIEGYSVEITLPDTVPYDDTNQYTSNKRITRTIYNKIIAIREYVDDNTYAIQTDVTLLFPNDRSASISYNSDSEITGDWVDANTDSSQNTYDSNTGDGTLYLNDGVDEIGGEGTREGLRAPLVNSPFYMNTNVRSVDMSNSGLITIGDHAFDSCANLANAVIPNTVTKIGVSAFAGCPLNSVDIPDSVTAIGTDAFTGGTTNVNYNGSASGSPWGAEYMNADTDASGLMFGNFDTKTYSCSVIGCTSVSNGDIFIPSTVDYEKSTYTVTAIGDNAFRNCTSIENITIPDTVDSLGGLIFKGCFTWVDKDKISTIKSVTELSATVPTTDANTFDSEVIIDTLYVPSEEAVTLYDAVWNKYFKNILTQKKNGENGTEER